MKSQQKLVFDLILGPKSKDVQPKTENIKHELGSTCNTLFLGKCISSFA